MEKTFLRPTDLKSFDKDWEEGIDFHVGSPFRRGTGGTYLLIKSGKHSATLLTAQS